MTKTSIKEIVEKLLNAKLGEGETLSNGPRSHVWRLPVLDTDGDLPTMVIVKQALESEFDGGSMNRRQRFIRELSALEFLNSLFEENPPIPRLYASDNENTVFVTEYIREGVGFHLDLLGKNIHQAEMRLMNIARTLGRIHTASADRLVEYNKRHEALGTLIPFGHDWLKKGWPRLTELSDIPLPEDIDTAYAEIEQIAKDAGRWSVFTHGDLCPDNILVTDEKAFIIDFEVSNFNTAGFDASYPRLMMPSCWCAAGLPKTLIERFEAVYRNELIKSRPEIADDKIFYRLLADGMALSLSINFSWSVWGGPLDSEMKLANWQQRIIYRLDSFYEMTKLADHHRILGDYAARTVNRLSKIWSSPPAPPYPTFSD